ncbi:MAG TPA: SpoIID/LytB domain-containing protein [Patescibacteria group bacterium]|nr:SpoIID/LytB domain-containing protein [Patescibacteria group bacterium]
MKWVISFFIIVLVFLGTTLWVKGDELDDINSQLEKLKRELDQSQKATAPLETTLTQLEKDLARIRSRIGYLKKEIARREKEVQAGEEALLAQKILLNERTKMYYIHARKMGTMLFALVSDDNTATSFQNFFYQKTLVDQDKDTIVKTVVHIKNLEEKKRNLEFEKIRLADIEKEVDKQSVFLSGEVTKAKKYQAELSSRIAVLSTRQKQLIAAKLAGLNLPTSLGAGPLYCTDDRKIDPGFSPGFAFFTFGIPHRVGMNQYGALGRSQAGQSYQDILRAYFDGVSFEKRDANMRIKVQGFGEMGLDEYLLGIHEMPADWPMEALKAQVVAARSYALSYTGNGAKEICTTQQCQVYCPSNTKCNKGGNWEAAVRQTEGEIMVRDGQAITAWYASTSGGYTFTSADVGWNSRPWTKRVRDTTGDVGSFGDLFERAYDKSSPCFYAAQGWRSEYGKSAWLKGEEVADIANVILLVRRDGGTREHLYQTDKSNPAGTDNWDKERVRQELRNRGENPYASVSDIGIDWDKGVGKTNSITINGDAGSRNFDGAEFKNFFNLRAPANIQIVGALYNVERR